MKLIAITGNAGSGKTTVSHILIRNGYCVIDADKVVHKLLDSEEVKNFIRKTFGDEYLDRKKLSDLLFKNPIQMEKYEKFIRKRVLNALNEEILKANCDIVFVDAALVFEYGLEYMFDKIICVVADEKKLIERLKIKGYSEDTARMILLRQIPQIEKAKRSDIIIENNGTIEELEKKVLDILKTLAN